MIHGPCGELNPGSPCMVNGRCSKRYPKAFRAVTQENENGFPIYRRREGKILRLKKTGGIAGPDVPAANLYEIDNRWIVPYNPALSKKYNCHINVEICTSIRCVEKKQTLKWPEVFFLQRAFLTCLSGQ